MEADGFHWWVRRIQRTAEQVDIIRIDHFRGLRAFWKIPGTEKTAEKGKWVKAPGEKLFAAVAKALPHAEIIAEDLGLITEDVTALRKKLHLPGMKILQFAFEFTGDGRFNSANGFLPHNYETDTVVLTAQMDFFLIITKQIPLFIPELTTTIRQSAGTERFPNRFAMLFDGITASAEKISHGI